MTSRYRSPGDRRLTAFVFHLLENNSRLVVSDCGGPPANEMEARNRIHSALKLAPNGAMARLIRQTTISTPALASQLDCDEAVVIKQIELGERGGLRLEEGGPWLVR